MKVIKVYIDERCQLCRNLAGWLTNQPAYLKIEIYQSKDGKTQHPEISEHFGEELVVINDQGEVFLGAEAWIICLFALKNYREWSVKLSSPILKPLARKAYYLIANNRLTLSSFLSSEDVLSKEIQNHSEPLC